MAFFVGIVNFKNLQPSNADLGCNDLGCMTTKVKLCATATARNVPTFACQIHVPICGAEGIANDRTIGIILEKCTSTQLYYHLSPFLRSSIDVVKRYRY